MRKEGRNFRLGLDEPKTSLERNRLGQFATPIELANDMLSYARDLLSTEKNVRFLDPGFGTGAFYSALLANFPANRITVSEGFEIDAHYAKPTAELWQDTLLRLHREDFTSVKAPEKDSKRFNLVVCNPPYVRHHHILNGDKNRLQDLTDKVFGERPSGLSGLYCYFLGLSHNWMRENGIAGWLIPSEFMDVNYGKSVKRYLLEQVTLLRIHRFDPIEVQFKDALVSSVIVWFRKKKPPVGHAVEFTFGGNLKNPKMSKKVRSEVLRHELKWTRFPLADARKRPSGSTLGDFFSVKRGLATGDNNFFVLTSERIAALELPMNFFVPILPSPRFLKVQEVKCDSEGIPMLNPRLFLLDCRLTPDLIEAQIPDALELLPKRKGKRGSREVFMPTSCTLVCPRN